jgi:hypothetical protein
MCQRNPLFREERTASRRFVQFVSLVRKFEMSLSKTDSMDAALNSILIDHFENCGNPHETIYKIWLLLNKEALSSTSLPLAFDRTNCLDVAKTKYH